MIQFNPFDVLNGVKIIEKIGYLATLIARNMLQLFYIRKTKPDLNKTNKNKGNALRTRI